MDEQFDALEAELPSAHTPEALVELAGRVDAFGARVAAAVANGDTSLRALLVRVPALYVRILLQAAERFDDRGSPRRAAVVLIEAMRRAFTPTTLGTVGEALAFVLEAADQRESATRVRVLVAARGGRPTTKLADEVSALHAAIDWDALPDDRFD